MSDILLKALRSESVSSSASSLDENKELSCGGRPCRKCGACRDWYQCQNSDNFVKRYNGSCNREFMYRHDLVRHPNPKKYFPLHNLVCMCTDNN